MSDFQNMSSRITVQAKIGDITQKKIDVLKPELSEIFPSVKMDENKNIIIFFNSNKFRSLILANNDFTVSFDKTNDSINWNLAQKVIEIVLDKLQLENKYPARIRITGLLPSTTGNALNESLSFNNDRNVDDWEELLGIGLRYFYEHKGTISEIKIEPFLQDNNNYYIENQMNLSSSYNANELSELAETAYEDTVSKSKEIIGI